MIQVQKAQGWSENKKTTTLLDRLAEFPLKRCAQNVKSSTQKFIKILSCGRTEGLTGRGYWLSMKH